MAKTEEKVLTYGELKAKLETLEPFQLDMEVRVIGEEKGFVIGYVEILQEDHINPSGDGIEPVSSYADDPEYADEEVVLPAGTVLLYIAE